MTKEYIEEVAAKSHYVNNKELFETLSEYRVRYLETKAAGLERPPMPNSVATAIVQIATKMSRLHNFVSYSYRQDMISDAILQCTAKFHLFDPEKSNNPFAYYSQITWQSYVGRIKQEQKQTSIKARLINDKVTSEFVQQNLENDTEGTNAFVDFLKENEIFVDYYEQRKTQNQTGTVHPKLKHRNLNYIKKEEKVKESTETNIFELADE